MNKAFLKTVLMLASATCLAADKGLTKVIEHRPPSPKIQRIQDYLGANPGLDVSQHIKQTTHEIYKNGAIACCGCGCCLYGAANCLICNEPSMAWQTVGFCLAGIGTCIAGYGTLNAAVEGATLGSLNRHQKNRKAE